MPGIPAGWQKVAAVLTGLLVVSLGAYWWLSPKYGPIAFRTQAQETRIVLLPDGSRVTLNANSSLRIADDWAETASREVWLEGEGYFEVKHFQEPARKFIVHAKGVEVEVLGTTFNVWERQDQLKVVLQTGKVQLKHSASSRTVRMRPGQMAELNVNRPQVTVRPVDAQLYTSWKNHQLVFDGTPMPEVAALIELRYGYRVAFADSLATREKLTYKPSNDDFALFIEVLRESFRVQLDEERKTLTIGSL